jgi:hypothetical protein
MEYYRQFPDAILHLGVHSIPLLTLPPLSPLARFSFDLHVLAMPPAFNLSQDQTLRLKFVVLLRLAPPQFDFKEVFACFPIKLIPMPHLAT